MKVRAGFESNGLPGGKRDLREKKNMIKNNMFRDPFKLILGIIMIVYTFVTVLIRDVLFRRHLKKPKSLKGKVCFVTGSGRGLGREICIALANEGAIIACADINEENNKTTVEILSGMGTKAMGYTLNVAKRLEVEAVAKQVETDLGNVFLLVNNAAIVLPCIEPDEDQVRAVFNVNTIGPIWTTTTFLDKMKKENAGHIVNISSLAAAYGTVSAPLYGASKAALTSYAQAVRLTLKSEGYNNIFVTTVHPGLINTSADYMDLIDSRLPVHEPEYVARFVLKAVKYNTGDVSPQPFLFLFALLGNMAPVAVVERCMQLMDVTLTLPTLEEYKKLPMGDIIQKSNNVK